MNESSISEVLKTRLCSASERNHFINKLNSINNNKAVTEEKNLPTKDSKLGHPQPLILRVEGYKMMNKMMSKMIIGNRLLK